MCKCLYQVYSDIKCQKKGTFKATILTKTSTLLVTHEKKNNREMKFSMLFCVEFFCIKSNNYGKKVDEKMSI